MTTTTTLRITGMHCASCGLLVDDELEDIEAPRVQWRLGSPNRGCGWALIRR